MLHRILILLFSFLDINYSFKEISIGVKLTRGGLVMINFICQLYLATSLLDIWSNIQYVSVWVFLNEVNM